MLQHRIGDDGRPVDDRFELGRVDTALCHGGEHCAFRLGRRGQNLPSRLDAIVASKHPVGERAANLYPQSQRAHDH